MSRHRSTYVLREKKSVEIELEEAADLRRGGGISHGPPKTVAVGPAPLAVDAARIVVLDASTCREVT